MEGHALTDCWVVTSQSRDTVSNWSVSSKPNGCYTKEMGELGVEETVTMSITQDKERT